MKPTIKTPSLIKQYSTAQAAKMIGRCPRTIQRYCEQGLLLGQKVGRNWNIGEDAIRAFVLPPMGCRAKDQ